MHAPVAALPAHFAAMARNNAWSNARLYRACLTLSDAAFADMLRLAQLPEAKGWRAISQALLDVGDKKAAADMLERLATPESLPDNDRLVGVDAVDLKHVLGDIQPGRGNLHLDGSLM